VINVIGADTETCEGIPISLQFFSEDIPLRWEFIEVDEHSAMREFFAFLESLPTAKHGTHNVIYCHNLAFDLVGFFYKARAQLIEPGNIFEFTYRDWNIRGNYPASGAAWCMLRQYTQSKSKGALRTVDLVDSHAWFQGTLAQAAMLFCPDLPKLKRPKNLGTVWYTGKDENFVEYAMRDAEIDYHIGKSVQAIHDEYDVSQGMTNAGMAAKIFRHHYLDYTIPHPRHDVIAGSLASYHGGKNNVVAGTFPAWHTNVTAVDISSAYPFAMSLLPAFDNPRGYRRVTFNRGCKPKQVPPFGVYKISGQVKNCDWPVIFSHGFKPIQGRVENVWVQGMELNEALNSGELRLSKIYGHMYDPDKDRHEPALKKYVDDIYKRKEEAEDKRLRQMYKIMLNSLYGKFIEKRAEKSREVFEITPEDDVKMAQSLEFTAGPMCHPFIASAITAHTRAYMHEVEHDYKAIHTATDGVFTYSRRLKRIANYPKRGLGSLALEGRGDLLLFRNKCYILYSDADGFPSRAFRGKRIVKYAKHGFQGSVYQLEQLAAKNKRGYVVNKPNRLRDSVKRGLQVNKFVERPMILKVGPIGIGKPVN